MAKQNKKSTSKKNSATKARNKARGTATPKRKRRAKRSVMVNVERAEIRYRKAVRGTITNLLRAIEYGDVADEGALSQLRKAGAVMTSVANRISD